MGSEVWQGVHPASILVNLVPRLWSLVRSLWPLLLALLAGGLNRQGVADAMIIGVFFATGLASSAIHALTLRYRVVNGRLEIRSGLVDRQARVVPLERIQNVSMVRNIFQRLSGLVEVRIETASGREAEGLLSAITVSRAEELISALAPTRSAPVGEPQPETTLVENSVLDLVWAGASDLRLGALAVGIGVLVGEAPFVTEETALIAEQFSGFVGLFIGLALVSGAWLAGIGSAVLRGYGFRLVKSGRALVAERGLLTRRRAEIVRAKVQLVTWTEPLLLRINGLGSLAIETAASREAGPGTERAEVVVPVVDSEQVRRVSAAVLDAGEVDPTDVVLRPAHPLALRRALFRALRSTVLLVGLGVFFFGSWGALAVLAGPILLLAARLDVLRQGYLVTDQVIVSRQGYVTRQTQVLLRDKVQSVDVVQGPVLRSLGLGLTVIRVAGSRITLPLLAVEEAWSVQALLIARR
jgi:putative membrane protein